MGDGRVTGKQISGPEAGDDEQEDAVLIRLARDGGRAAFATLLGRHWELLLALCRRALGDPELARDAAQEAALQAMLGLDRLRQDGSFGPWLGGIGLNVCRSWLRYRPRDDLSWEALQGGRLALEFPDDRPDPGAVAEAADLAARVSRAVAGLPRGQRAAVLLHYLSGLTYAETAEQLGVEVGAVKTRLHKARAALRRQLLSLWEEETMTVSSTPTETQTEAVEMRVVDVRLVARTDERPDRHYVILEEVDGSRTFLFGVGPFEGHSIAMLLERIELKRPLTYAFLASVLEAAGGRLTEARITRLADETFYAVAVIEGAAGIREVDARPSDAVSLALLVGAPILVDAAVLATVEQGVPTRGLPVAEHRQQIEAGSIGAAEITARVREHWQQVGWQPKAE
jgi:RNA polymerase sigma factor (sigma-70 family)